MTSTIVITSCTNRKRGRGVPVRLPAQSTDRPNERTIDRWKGVVSCAARDHCARDLYLGRAFSDARKAATVVHGELLVVSAGLGLLHEVDKAPEYDLTFADPDNPLAVAMRREGFSASDWWTSLGEAGIGRGTIADHIRAEQPGLVLVALPSRYLDMVASDLSKLPDHFLQRVRLITSPAGVIMLDNRLSSVALPYDERLEAVAGFAGTRTDFAQRALLHFVSRLAGHELDLETSKQVVRAALEELAVPRVPDRVRMNDTQIAAVLRQQWAAHRGSSTRLLQFLRHDAGIACEQGRFRDIWRAIKNGFSLEGRQ